MPSLFVSQNRNLRIFNLEETQSTELKPQQYEISQKFFPLFIKAHDNELQKIENGFQVKVSRNIDDGKVTVAPYKHCTAETFNEASLLGFHYPVSKSPSMHEVRVVSIG